ncbi:hypothetical protein V1264_017946 [Littorina saxatilis]|uniref:Paired domain-containing protein n=1 Tax=Littorina saxatilis TaxID=31220 RepID=A0AAN9BK98_9CAEN
MPPRRKLNEFEKGRAVAWFQDDVPKREVTRRLHVSISVIVRLIQRFTATGRVQERRRPGRPKKTTPREDRLIERLAFFLYFIWCLTSFSTIQGYIATAND